MCVEGREGKEWEGGVSEEEESEEKNEEEIEKETTTHEHN